jgi:hypothetical protein
MSAGQKEKVADAQQLGKPRADALSTRQWIV